MSAPLREESRKDWQGVGSSGVLPNGENLAGPQESALVRTGITSWIQNDFERVVFPQHPSLAEIKRILGLRHTGGSPLCFAIRVRFGALRVVPDPRRCGSSLPAIGARPGSESVDPDPAPLENTGAKCFCSKQVDSRPLRERLAHGCLKCWAIV